MGSVSGTQFRQNVLDVGFRRFLIDVQMSRNRLIGIPGGNQFEDLDLPSSQQSMRRVLRDFGGDVCLHLLFAGIHNANGIQYLGTNEYVCSTPMKNAKAICMPA
jgi:hypothetical protein